LSRSAALRVLAFVPLLVPTVATAQGRGEPAALAAMRVGPLALTPTMALRDVGIDTNPLGEPDADRDFTMAFVPGVDAWMRVGRLRLTSETEVEWQYFREHASQRAFSVTQKGIVEARFAYFTPYVTGTYENTKRRQTAEIDVRVRQRLDGLAAGVKVFPGARSELGLERRWQHVDFGDAEFGGAALAEALNRDNEATEFSARYAVTSLTTIVARAAVERDRFDDAALRDADSWRIVPGLEFKASAFVSGSAFVGYRRFETVEPGVPDFEGLVAAVDLKYVARDMTRVTARMSRDVEFSFEALQPFFVQTLWHFGLTQAVTYDWDVRAEVGRTDLDYEALEPLAVPDRRDRIWVYGVGVGRRFGTELRVGVDVTAVTRRSDLPGRSYDGIRAGGSVTYGY
jgi:hypothetical protein